MMEGMNQMGQEEYIWAMRTSAYRESDSELWKERRSTAAAFLPGALRKAKSALENMADYDRQTKVMASLVPDEVIYNVNDYSARSYDACFLFGDVSGFTELCEKYTKTGISGPSRMTQVLNRYLGSMVQEVLSHNGDVLKFSGDAFLAVFKATESDSTRDAVHEALDCALVIQKNYGSYLTDVGVIIRVKLAVSAGMVIFKLIGNKRNSHYVVVGKPIWDVKAAESISTAGDIIVAPAAWHYVSTNEYLSEEMPDGIHIKLVGIGPNWRSVQKSARQQKPSATDDNISEESESSDSFISNVHQDLGMEEFSLRPAVNVATRQRIKEDLRKFIIAPVMKSIDMDEPFEYLTEMRQTVIVFINVVSTKLNAPETVVLSDQTYQIVCRVVDKLNGCVNKVSLFDKDLMLVVIFGLRGLKHELECQVALRCARECHEAIRSLDNVTSVSIGVTTGKTYCGVFGHTLRREYTVISLIVNKAARLMVAYKNKVTCDRETFLHSKLEAKNFILQPQKRLKGISHPGPVYEFSEVKTDHEASHKINSCPLLGRVENMKTYRRLLERSVQAIQPKEQQYKMLVILGEPRQGKSRLLEEMIYVTSKNIPINRFSLTQTDFKIPYQTLRLIFNPALNLTKESSTKQKEQKLLTMLRKIKVPELLCVLNSVFGVNFKISEIYLSLGDKAKWVALKKMIRQLCYACFISQWVIAIDDCDFVDEETWQLFDTLFDIRNVFIIATRGRNTLLNATKSEKILNDPRVRTFILQPIQRSFLGALACQILNVYAISPELEKVIQERSNGNPGWVESFLISMIQDEMLYILKANLKEINDLGLVCPPLYLMTRLSKDETVTWQHIMEERRPSIDSTVERDRWTQYIDSCRDSYLNITIREQMESMSIGGKVPVCVIAPNFRVGEEEGELSMDAMIMKTFDSLNFYEQLLVKCSAILGNQFSRDMLMYVMAASSMRQAALAVQKLFEIRVLTCARGDFADSMKVSEERLINPAEDSRIVCKCSGLKIDETCRDLPKYASCGYMEFTSSLFRDITYNLLTDNQKKEFHHRAIRFLERETRRCKACGNDYFEQIAGVKHDKDFLKTRDKNKKQLNETSSWETSSVSHRMSIHSAGQHSIDRRRSKWDEKSSVLSAPSTIYGETKVEKNFNAVCGYTIINRLKNSFSLTRAFSTDDFTDCQCSLILTTTYAQMTEHCLGAGDLNKLLETMIEYAQVCIISYNIPLAMKILNTALDVVKQKAKRQSENVWKLSLIRGRLYTLIGYSKLEVGHYDEAMTNLHRALSEYDIRFPKGTKKKLKICQHNFKHLFTFYVFPRVMFKQLDHWETVFANNLSECLSHLCTLYMSLGQWDNAELAAAWSLTKAMQSFSDFRVIAIACANMIYVAQHLKKWNLCIALEIHALRFCHLKTTRIEPEELKGVAKLYGVIFCSRMLRSDLDKAIHMGYIVLRLCSSLRAVKIILPLLPLLMHSLLIGKHTTMALSILQELDYFSDEDTDSSGKVWYYALCVCFQLETGYTVLPYNMCEEFYQVEGDNWVTIRDPDARKRFFTVMWLWCIRTERWESAALWCIKTKDFMVIKESDTLANKITALYLLEGMILYLVAKLDRRNIEAVIIAESEIKHLMDAIEHSGKETKMILPRLYHLKAYFRYVKYNDSKVDNLLYKARTYAKKYGNALETDWIEHSIKAWNKQLTIDVAEFWKEHADPDNSADLHELEMNTDKFGYYTLPTPLYL